ncbi:nucleotide exchange factor GrpE [Gardnerella greenwoodii]|uniref:nucleotide exchange factor GrpE n=1 Tax=Gardnerella greenwoodii TaxID=2914925 RepID=UPI0039EFF83E
MSDFNTNEYLQGMEDSDSLDVKPAEDSEKTSAQSSKQTENANRAETKADAKTDANVSADSADSANAANSSESSESSESKDSKDADDGSLTPLGKAKKEAAEYLEALQRERAEFINFRNRSAKEQDRFRQHGIIDVLTALLPALDDIDRIREHSEMDDSFKAVATKIDKAFAKFGVEKFGEKGEDFDPTKHDAVLHRPDPDATKETVDAVVEAGYRIGERVIRAARVVVSSPSNS